MIYRDFETIPPLRYGLIMADPPWQFANWSDAGEGRNASKHYKCQSADDLAALPVSTLAAPDCLIWLWATNPMLPQALKLMADWGFAFKTAGHWAKVVPSGKQAFGTGYILRRGGEPFLIGTIGKPKTSRSVRSVVIGPRREHSRKPDEAYTAAENLMPSANRIDLFSRQPRPNWDSWGDEAEKFNPE